MFIFCVRYDNVGILKVDLSSTFDGVVLLKLYTNQKFCLTKPMVLVQQNESVD